jgi:hypothetical protein
LNYTGVPDLTLSISGYFGEPGQGEFVFDESGNELPVRANISLGTAYAAYEKGNFRFVTVGAYGELSDTERIYSLTERESGVGQVLGESVFGYLVEGGVNVLPYLRKGTPRHTVENRFVKSSEMKLTFFTRYERLNTHRTVNPLLADFAYAASDLNIVTTGINFNTRENIVLKSNIQFVRNAKALIPEARNRQIVEFGLGFIF